MTTNQLRDRGNQVIPVKHAPDTDDSAPLAGDDKSPSSNYFKLLHPRWTVEVTVAKFRQAVEGDSYAIILNYGAKSVFGMALHKDSSVMLMHHKS